MVTSPTVFEVLTQHFEDVTGEFRQFVQEQDAVMGQADLSRPRDRSAPDQAGGRNAVMGCAERPLFHEAVVVREQTGTGVDPRRFQALFECHRRDHRRDPSREHRLAGTGRTDHQNVVDTTRQEDRRQGVARGRHWGRREHQLSGYCASRSKTVADVTIDATDSHYEIYVPFCRLVEPISYS